MTKNIKKTPFMTCLCCIDGRIQEQVIQFIQKKYDVKWVDMINEPGIHNIINASDLDDVIYQWLCKKIQISFDAHQSEKIFIVAHEDCAAHVVDYDTHIHDLQKARHKISNSLNVNLSAIGLIYAHLNGEITLIQDLD